MRITIIQGAFFPVPSLRGGAVEKMWFRLGTEFAARGHTVTHVSRRCDGLPAEERLLGVRHFRVAGSDQPRGALAIKLRDLVYTWRALRRVPPGDVVVTNTFWAPLLLPRNRGAIVVDMQRMPKGQVRLYRRAARLRANSSAVAEAIGHEEPTAMPRVRVIPNPLPFVAEREPDWARKTRTVVFAGRLHPEKGIELLLRAWALGRQEGRLGGWNLELIGPSDSRGGGGGEEWVRALRARVPTSGVTWQAPIFGEAELNRAYERASVFVYPSVAEIGETFGQAVLEAMAWGAVPVVSDLACFRDFVRSAENGWVFDHRAIDAPRRLLEAIERATRPESRALAERALAVRTTHASATIAGEFLADFSGLVREERCE